MVLSECNVESYFKNMELFHKICTAIDLWRVTRLALLVLRKWTRGWTQSVSDNIKLFSWRSWTDSRSVCVWSVETTSLWNVFYTKKDAFASWLLVELPSALRRLTKAVSPRDKRKQPPRLICNNVTHDENFLSVNWSSYVTSRERPKTRRRHQNTCGFFLALNLSFS